MCPPIIAAIAAGAAIASTAASVTATVAGANAQASAAEAEAQQAEENKRLAGLAEADVLRQGSAEAARVRGMGTRLISEQQVARATSGFDISSGTASDTYADTELVSEMDALTIKANAARDAWGYRTQGIQYEKQAKFTREAGRQAVTGTFLTGAANALGGLASSASAINTARSYFR